MPARAKSAPAEEEELVDSKTLGLIGDPARPSGHGVQDDDASRAETEENAHENVAGGDSSKVRDDIDEIEVYR